MAVKKAEKKEAKKANFKEFEYSERRSNTPAVSSLPEKEAEK